ncbi:MAG: hypothetical protein M3Y72_07865 [Acidobacteriota bacterium]|nr:hypothetical protein [Acidobacteriota bacterium]
MNTLAGDGVPGLDKTQIVGTKASGSHLGRLLAVIFILKVVLYSLDPHTRFQLGDSASYLYTALTGWMPPDRSFTYGFLIRPLAVWTHSFVPLMIFQFCISGIAAWIVSVCLVRFFRVRFWLAAVAGLLCAIGPLQLISERFVLTEAPSTFLFAFYILLALEYMKSGRLAILVLLQVVAIPLISLRISFLPLVLLSSLLLPLLGPWGRILWRKMRDIRGQNGFPWPGLRQAVVHLLIAVVVSQVCLFCYRHVNGRLSKLPAAYVYADGQFLLCFWAPIVQKGDFPIPELRNAIFDSLQYNLRDPELRNNQCYSPGGLIPNLTKAVEAHNGGPDEQLVYKLAKRTALAAARRDPLALIRLSAKTFAGYFDNPSFRTQVEVDEGFHNSGSPEFKQELLTKFGERYDGVHIQSLIQRYHNGMVPWYRFLIAAPLVFIPLALFADREYLPQWIYLGIVALMFAAQAVVVAPTPTARYLTALSWVVILMFSAALGTIYERQVSRTNVP